MVNNETINNETINNKIINGAQNIELIMYNLILKIK